MDMEKTLVTYIHRIDEDTIRHHNYNVHHNMVPTKAFIGKFRRDGSEKLLKEKEVNEKDKEYPVNGPIINSSPKSSPKGTTNTVNDTFLPFPSGMKYPHMPKLYNIDPNIEKQIMGFMAHMKRRDTLLACHSGILHHKIRKEDTMLSPGKHSENGKDEESSYGSSGSDSSRSRTRFKKMKRLNANKDRELLKNEVLKKLQEAYKVKCEIEQQRVSQFSSPKHKQNKRRLRVTVEKIYEPLQTTMFFPIIPDSHNDPRLAMEYDEDGLRIVPDIMSPTRSPTRESPKTAKIKQLHRIREEQKKYDSNILFSKSQKNRFKNYRQYLGQLNDISSLLAAIELLSDEEDYDDDDMFFDVQNYGREPTLNKIDENEDSMTVGDTKKQAQEDNLKNNNDNDNHEHNKEKSDDSSDNLHQFRSRTTVTLPSVEEVFDTELSCPSMPSITGSIPSGRISPLMKNRDAAALQKDSLEEQSYLLSTQISVDGTDNMSRNSFTSVGSIVKKIHDEGGMNHVGFTAQNERLDNFLPMIKPKKTKNFSLTEYLQQSENLVESLLKDKTLLSSASGQGPPKNCQTAALPNRKDHFTNLKRTREAHTTMTGYRKAISPKFLSDKQKEFQDLKVIAVQAPINHTDIEKNDDPYQRGPTTSYYSSSVNSSYHSGNGSHRQGIHRDACSIFSSRSEEMSFPGDMTAATDDMTYQGNLRPIEYDSQDNYRYSTIFRESYMDGFNMTSPTHGALDRSIRSPPITPPTIRSSHLTRQQGLITASNSFLDLDEDERRKNEHREQFRSKLKDYEDIKPEHKSHLLNGLKWKMKTSSLPLTLGNDRKRRKSLNNVNFMAGHTKPPFCPSSNIYPVNICSIASSDPSTQKRSHQKRKENFDKIYGQMETSITTSGPTLKEMASKINMGERDYSEQLEKFDFRRLLDSSKPPNHKSLSPPIRSRSPTVAC